MPSLCHLPSHRPPAQKLKNNLRQEMDTSSRLAAMEALGRSGGGSGTVVSNNNNMSSSAACSSVAAANTAAAEATRAAAAATAAMAAAAAKAARTPVLLGHEKYCGGTSWLIGICLFPCICCCPVDTRPVYGFPGMPMAITGGKAHKSAGSQNVYQPPRSTKMV